MQAVGGTGNVWPGERTASWGERWKGTESGLRRLRACHVTENLALTFRRPLPEIRLAGEGDREAVLGSRSPNSSDGAAVSHGLLCAPCPSRHVLAAFIPFTSLWVGPTEEFYNRT